MAEGPRTTATTARDPRVVRAARLLREEDARREERAFVVDGEELLAEAIAARVEVETLLVDAERVGGGEALALGGRTGADLVVAAPDAMRSVAAVGQSPRIVAVCRMPPEPPRDLPARSLVLARVSDAGNVGSIVRTAAALRLPRVTLTPGCADPWSRKALRAALGASFAPGLVATGRSLDELARLRGRPPRAAAVRDGGVEPGEVPPGAAIVLGSERDGLAPDDVAACDLRVTIPAGGFESLNVSAAAAILAFELSRRA